MWETTQYIAIMTTYYVLYLSLWYKKFNILNLNNIPLLGDTQIIKKNVSCGWFNFIYILMHKKKLSMYQKEPVFSVYRSVFSVCVFYDKLDFKYLLFIINLVRSVQSITHYYRVKVLSHRVYELVLWQLISFSLAYVRFVHGFRINKNWKLTLKTRSIFNTSYFNNFISTFFFYSELNWTVVFSNCTNSRRRRSTATNFSTLKIIISGFFHHEESFFVF